MSPKNVPIYLPRIETANACHQARHFHEGSRYQSQAFILMGEHFTNWAKVLSTIQPSINTLLQHPVAKTFTEQRFYFSICLTNVL